MVIVFITQLDGGAVPTMLPSITRTFGLTTMGSSWVVGLYTLGLVVGTPITSNLSDAHGTRKVFLWELAFWFLGCLMTAVSPNYAIMLLGRFIQSLGDSGIMVLSMNVLLQRARRNNQGRKVSTVGIIAGLSAMVSPVLSGMLLGITHGWRAYYFMMLPFLAILFILAWFMMGDSQTDRAWKTDYLGLSSFSIALALLMVAITFLQYGTAYLALIIGCLLVAVVAGAIFLVHERNLGDAKDIMPFLPIRLLKLPSYGLTLLLGTLGGMFFSLFVYIPTYVHSVFGLPVRSAGMVMVGVGLGSVRILAGRAPGRQVRLPDHACLLIVVDRPDGLGDHPDPAQPAALHGPVLPDGGGYGLHDVLAAPGHRRKAGRAREPYAGHRRAVGLQEGRHHHRPAALRLGH